MRNVPDAASKMRAVFWQVLEALGALPVSMAPTLTLALGLTVRLESPPPLDRLDVHHRRNPRPVPTMTDLDDDLTASLTSWRPRDLTSTAGETCDGKGRQGEGKGEAWRLENSAEAGIVGVDVGASPASLEEVVELPDDVEDDQVLEDPRQVGPRRRRRR